jgi:hypothetical protein
MVPRPHCRFTGNGISLITEKWSTAGQASVSIDGGAPTTVSLAQPANAYQQVTFAATGLTNCSHTIKVTKSSGGQIVIDALAVTSLAPVVPASSAYGRSVLAANPSDYWRLDETSGTTAADYAGASSLTEGTGITHQAAGALAADPDTADTFSGTSTGWAQTSTLIPAPQTFTEQAWIKTSSTSPAQLTRLRSIRPR